MCTWVHDVKCSYHCLVTHLCSERLQQLVLQTRWQSCLSATTDTYKLAKHATHTDYNNAQLLTHWHKKYQHHTVTMASITKMHNSYLHYTYQISLALHKAVQEVWQTYKTTQQLYHHTTDTPNTIHASQATQRFPRRGKSHYNHSKNARRRTRTPRDPPALTAYPLWEPIRGLS